MFNVHEKIKEQNERETIDRVFAHFCAYAHASECNEVCGGKMIYFFHRGLVPLFFVHVMPTAPAFFFSVDCAVR